MSPGRAFEGAYMFLVRAAYPTALYRHPPVYPGWARPADALLHSFGRATPCVGLLQRTSVSAKACASPQKCVARAQ